MSISSNTSQEYFNIQPRKHKISKVDSVSPGSERQPAHGTTSKVVIHSRRKVRRITCKLTSISQRYGIFILIQSNMNIATSQRQIQLIMAPTKKQNPTTTIRQLPSNAYLRKSTRSPGISQHNTIEQHFPTLQHSTSTMLSYTISKVSQVLSVVQKC